MTTIKIPFIPKQNLSLNSDLLSSRKQNLFEALEEKNLIREASNRSRYDMNIQITSLQVSYFSVLLFFILF